MRIHELIPLVLCVLLVPTLLFAEEAVSVDGSEAPRARWGASFGVGADLLWRREINPSFGEFAGGLRAYAAVRFERITAQLEYERAADRRTRSGGFAVRTAAESGGVWGRYAVDRRGPWTTFASLGGGVRFERVRTTFDRAVDERRGSRRFVGLGFGSSYLFGRYVSMDAEARVTSEEATRFPGLALIVRAGVAL